MGKKLIFFLGSMKRGGAERVISILSKKYAEKNWDTNIALLLSNGVEYELDQSTQIFDLTNERNSRIKNTIHWIKSIRSLVKRENPDVVVSFAARINILVLLSCIGLNKKVIISERNDPYSDGRGFVVNILTNILYPYAHSVVFQTKRAQGYFKKKIIKKSVIIPNPIEVDVKKLNTNSNKIVSVGRLEKQKNHTLLIASFKKVHNLYPNIELHIYGEGSLRDELMDQIIQLDLENKVYLQGKVADIHEKIKDALFFVLSSDYEGLSNALLEAMAMGIPCISTSCAGSDEYIDNNKSGILVPIGDIDKLTEAMEKFIIDVDFRNECGNAAQKESIHYSTDIVLKQWDEVLGEKNEKNN